MNMRPDAAHLYRVAEARLASQLAVRPIDELLLELQLQQIELEMQNEQLRRTQSELERAAGRYRDLYEFAPVGYLTLDRQDLIAELNQTAAALLGTRPDALLHCPLADYIFADDRNGLQRYLREARNGLCPYGCELKMLRADGGMVNVRIGSVTEHADRNVLRITLTEIEVAHAAKHQSAPSDADLLRESEQKFRAIFESTMDGVVLIDDTGMIADCNAEFERQSGRTIAQLKQMRIWELRPSHKAHLAREEFLKVIETGSDAAAALKFKQPDGNVIHIEIRGRMLGIGGKRYIQCITHDISDRRRAESLLRESEEKLRAIFEGALDGISLVEPTTRRFVDCNPEFCRMIGYTRDQIAQISVDDIHPAQDLPWILEQFEKHLHGTCRLTGDIPVKRRDGSVFYVDIKSAPVTLNNRIYLVGIFRDVSERRQAEEIRRLSALRHQLLFESSRDALMTVAPPLWKFTGANEATLKLFGISGIAEFSRYSPVDLSPLRQPGGELSGVAAQQMIDIALRNGSHFFEWEHRKLDGTPFTASVLLTRMELGDEMFLLATVRDITEHKQRELEIRESQALLRELAVQGTATREAELKHIAREVHDELGQLLTALRMDISLLRIQFGERDPLLMNKIQAMLVLVDKAIGGVRDVSANLRPPALDMGIAAAILWLGDEFTARTNTACKVIVRDDPLGLNDSCTLTLFRIVQESLTNVARHALANLVEIRIEQCDEAICVEVRDDGKGFDPGVMRQKNSFGLMGMNERALAVGGKVEINSAPSQGTVVCVRIPLS